LTSTLVETQHSAHGHHKEQTILFRNTMRITDGHLDGFRRAIAQAVARRR
jgi:hypothetical protein